LDGRFWKFQFLGSINSKQYQNGGINHKPETRNYKL
jgi:hypothetical protein